MHIAPLCTSVQRTSTHTGPVCAAQWDVVFEVGLTLDPVTSTAIGPGVGSIGIDRDKLYPVAQAIATRGLRSSRAGPRLLAGEIVEVSVQARTVEGWSLRTGGATVTMSFEPRHSVVSWRARSSFH